MTPKKSVVADGPAEGADNAPWMDYEDAGKEAYAEERVIVFRAKPTGQKFAAHPDGSYVALTRPVEPAAPVVSRETEEIRVLEEVWETHMPSQPTPVGVRPSPLEGARYRGTRNLGVPVSLHCVSVDHPNGEWEAIYTHTSWQAEEIVRLSAHPTPLPSDQKETFEQWRLSYTHPPIGDLGYQYTTAVEMMLAAWNAAKGGPK